MSDNPNYPNYSVSTLETGLWHWKITITPHNNAIRSELLSGAFFFFVPLEIPCDQAIQLLKKKYLSKLRSLEYQM